MSIFIVQLGTPRKPAKVCGSERCGGLRAAFRSLDFARLHYYDVWFPNLSPSAELLQEALGGADERAWAAFSRKFRREMSSPDRSRQLAARLLCILHPFPVDCRNPAPPRAAAREKACHQSRLDSSVGGVADHMVTQMLSRGDADVLKLYSQAKLGMMREALTKLDRKANERRILNTERAS